jgi:uncharacterized membrane protein YdjX (TVP38/TMEM64 family)
VNRKQFTLLFTIVAVVTAYLIAGGEDLLNIRVYQVRYQESPLATSVVFFLVFLLGTALSLPVSGFLSVLAGFIFGNIVGFPLALLACAFGGTLAYLTSRYILHDLIQRRFGDQLFVINKGIKKDGAFYVFSLRMIPVIPFWLLNLLIGLTPMSASRFFVATFTGMMPITLILVYFGGRVGSIESISPRAIFTPGLLLSLALLASLPFIARRIVNLIQRRRDRGHAAD